MTAEWVLMPGNVGQLYVEIPVSEVHDGFHPVTGRPQANGLVIPAHADLPRTVARFGDTIHRDDAGRYTVTSPEGDPR